MLTYILHFLWLPFAYLDAVVGRRALLLLQVQRDLETIREANKRLADIPTRVAYQKLTAEKQRYELESIRFRHEAERISSKLYMETMRRKKAEQVATRSSRGN